MIHITLKDDTGAVQEVTLPAPVKELTRNPSRFALAGELQALDFHTPDAELNAGLKACLQPLPTDCAKELHLLGYLLERMNEPQRYMLRDHLPDAPCHISDLLQRSIYIADVLFFGDGTINDNARPLKECRPFVDESNIDEMLQREFRTHLDRNRLTGGQLFAKAVDCARASGDLAHFDAIHEYILPEEHDNTKITQYEFEFVPIVNYGCEGIYINCSLKGEFDQSEKNHRSVGTIKTLEDDLPAAKVMGELCGILLHHEYAYVNANLWQFTPTKEIERDIARKLESEQTQNQGMTQQMG